MKSLLLLKMGTAHPDVMRAVGDYDRWFFTTLGFAGLRWTSVQLPLGQRVPEPLRSYDAVVISGSPQSLTDPADWMVRAAGTVREAADQGVPILGVCFGHQLLGWAHGVKVIRNPLGREVGSVSVRLTSAGARDPLFAGVPETFLAQTTHEDILEAVPRGSTLLAGNVASTIQALAFGPHVRSVQFHPELGPEGMRAVLEARRETLRAEALARGEDGDARVAQLFQGLQPSGDGLRILRNFLAHFT